MSLETDTGYGHPHPPKSNILRKRVAGVPVVYLAGGVVLILAVYAYKARSTATAADAEPDEDEGTLASTGSIGADIYPGMPQGTVIVAPAPTAPSGPSNSSVETNDQWLRLGVALLVKSGRGAGTAQEALQAYLNGNRLSYDQGTMRDMVLNEYGLPPYAPDSGGTDPKIVPVVLTPPKPVIPVVNAPVPVPAKSPAPSAKPAPVATKYPYPGILRQGSTGANVKLVQAKVGVTVDGIFGPKTKAAVVVWQRSHGLAADGVVGPLTWAKMFG